MQYHESDHSLHLWLLGCLHADMPIGREFPPHYGCKGWPLEICLKGDAASQLVSHARLTCLQWRRRQTPWHWMGSCLKVSA